MLKARQRDNFEHRCVKLHLKIKSALSPLRIVRAMSRIACEPRFGLSSDFEFEILPASRCGVNSLRANERGFVRNPHDSDGIATIRGSVDTPKNGRGPPTSPALRLRVLTPRNQFAHRGGGRGQRLCIAYDTMQLSWVPSLHKAVFRDTDSF